MSIWMFGECDNTIPFGFKAWYLEMQAVWRKSHWYIIRRRLGFRSFVSAWDRRLIYILSRQWRIWIISWYSAAGTALQKPRGPLQPAGAWQRYVRVFDERTRYVADFFVSSFWHRHQRRAMSSGSPLSRTRCLVQFYPVPTRSGVSFHLMRLLHRDL